MSAAASNMWLVVNIGCIECGVSSDVVGVFADRDQANAIAETLVDKLGWRQGGQNEFEVFALPTAERLTGEYANAVAGELSVANSDEYWFSKYGESMSDYMARLRDGGDL